ncbi:uncharacterized protein LOC131208172 [Anopheles bellator]|uniref:uncharacterized protein LOC131208172 n=1 Tax=Anopheles bellator TaxID=139047 RepID=UPI002649AF52|nr:uncharacterized protein LOC131208172 [Anopheles bellator]
MPNERESLDDCHFRHYSQGGSSAVAPAFGVPAYLREFAHLGAIGWRQDDGSIQWNCGGSLIWENYVLTAAHCTADLDNKPPDVVRFGDINLYNDTDDAYAQQFNIAEVIRHPQHRYSAKYHDIALLKLEKHITLNETVAPACLWDEEELRFTTLQAAGWGATGYGDSQTPVLLKVSLGPVDTEHCNQFYRAGDRGLKVGLQPYQLCAGDVKMDTCPGDSGGPLEVKLLHNTKVTPFIVGVTSFGSACGQSTPGVYTKVAGYIPWIRSVLEVRGEEAPGSLYNNIAIVKLSDHFFFHNAERTLLLSRADQHRGVNCSVPEKYLLRLRNGLREEHLCYGNEPFLVPETCDLLYGGAVQRRVFRLEKYFQHVYALNLFGRDCGYGQSAVGVRISSHFEWLSKMLLTNRPKDSDSSVLFYNTDLSVGDHCRLPAGGSGLCVDVRRCPKVKYDFQIHRQVTFCGNSSIVCCPYHNVLNVTEQSVASRELDECEARYKGVHRKTYLYYELLEADKGDVDQFPHVVYIAWQSDNGSFYDCAGTLITKSVVLSTASCLERVNSKKVVVKLGFNATAPTLWIKEIILHPQFEPSTYRNDIAIAKIAGEVQPASGKMPACLWQNQTHTPFHLKQFMLTDTQYLNSYPMYNKDCEVFRHYGNRSLEPTQLCLSLEGEDQPIDPGEPAFWQKEFNDTEGSVVQYLVGIVSYVFPILTVHTRVESYVDWIKSII